MGIILVFYKKKESRMSTAKKEALSLIEELFKENAKGYITYEKLVKFLNKGKIRRKEP